MSQDQPAALPQMHEAAVRGDRWMATLAHELRSPLGAIMMSLEELRPICAADRSACVTQQAAMASAEHMARVIDGALDFCRGHREALRSETQQVDLAHIVVAAIRNSQRLISQKQHDVTLDIPLGKTVVPGDAT